MSVLTIIDFSGTSWKLPRESRSRADGRGSDEHHGTHGHIRIHSISSHPVVRRGRFVPAENNATFAVADPATGKSLTDVADASPADALRALDEAVAVSSKWASTPARERGEILRAVFEKITERAEDVALLMTLEMGKALAESRAEVKYGAEFFRWFSEEAVRIGGRYTPAPAGNGRILVTKRRSDRVWPSLPGISRWRWVPARSARHWPPAARSSSSPPRRPR